MLFPTLRSRDTPAEVELIELALVTDGAVIDWFVP
jgi:hypothetical protein